MENTEHTDADTRLVPIAKELAGALRTLVDLAYDCEIPADDEMVHEERVRIALAKADAALAKAGL